MRHSQLKAFHHVALLGGFSRAAEALFLTQPAISEQVRKLEQDHDVLLFHRERKRVRLTEAGEQLFRLTRQYFEVEQQIGDLMSESGAAIAGELRIIADSAHHVTAILSSYRRRFPNVTVSLMSGNTEDILEELRGYKAEIGVVGNASSGKEMASLSLGGTDIIAFAERGLLSEATKKLTMEDLVDLPLIFRENGSKTRQKLEEAAAIEGVTLKPAIVAEGREAVREVAASGGGVGFVSRAEYGHDDRLVPFDLTGKGLHMHETIVHLVQRQDVKVIRSFMEVARMELNAGQGDED